MPRPLLLIVDAESIRTPELASKVEATGWDLRWMPAAGAQAFLETGLLPDLLLLDAGPPGGSAWGLARALRARNPGLPVLVLAESGSSAQTRSTLPMEVQDLVDRNRPLGALTAALRRFLPGNTKLTTDEIFGDLLEDLERQSSTSRDPFGLLPRSSLGPGQPAPDPFGTDDIFRVALSGKETRPVAVPESGRLPVPSVTVAATMLQARPGDPPPGPGNAAPPETAEPLGPSEFTLSGITGVDDPFEQPAAKAGRAPSPRPPAPAAPPPPEAIEEYGNYFLLEKIAVGGMAELFKAQQRGVQGFQKIVAIKRILSHFSENDDFVTMFIDEAKLAAQLTHPNIVQIFDFGKTGNSYYIAMEYVNGRDLRTLLRKVRECGVPFPEQVAAFITMKVASALDYAHRKRGFDDRELKLVHRDISPQNVILSMEGAVKLVDFGIAKAASKGSQTLAGALKGKLLYMSPEQATGSPLDNRSDLYSLGLVLFELLTGERCFQADSEAGVLEKVRLGRVSDLAALNPAVSRDMLAIVNKALQRNVDHRYPSARFIERDLRDYLQRQVAPINEHDVAEYMSTLLRGSREEIETLVSTRFTLPARTAPGDFQRPAPEPAPPGAPEPGPRAEPEPSPESAPVPPVAEIPPLRPRWLAPTILALAVLFVIMLVVAVRS